MTGKSKLQTPATSPLNPNKIVYTTNREIWAWWGYMMCIEPVAIVVLQLFLILLLDSMSVQVGHLASDPTISCTGAIGEKCIIFDLGFMRINNTVYSYGIITLSVFLQSLVFLTFGALGDYGSMRNILIKVSTAVGSCLCVASLAIVGSWSAVFAAFLAIGITISFGVSLMLYNSYLPLLAENHKETVTFVSDDPEEITLRRESIASDLSTKSFMLGYASAVTLLIILCAAYYLNTYFENVTLLRAFIALTGILWSIGSIWPLRNMANRPGPPLPPGSNILTFSVKKTFRTLKKAKDLPHIFRYLLSFFLFADGYNTIGQVAVLFGRQELGLPISSLTICAILAPFSGICGNFFFFKLQRKLRLSVKRIMLILLSFFICLTMYPLIGLFSDKVGLKNAWEFYVMTIIYGFLMGAVQSFSRVLYGEMIPLGEESEFFSLYAITDKGSSWIGPLIQAVCFAIFDERRYGILALGLMILIPFPLLIWGINPTAGKQDAKRFSRENSIKLMMEK